MDINRPRNLRSKKKLRYRRDGFGCKINNQSCNGRMEAHHILSWRGHPELRYELNNGITLCHYHRPRGAYEEKRFESTFITMVATSVSIK
jgi:hypothetical protein